MTSQGVTFCGRGHIQSGNLSRCPVENDRALIDYNIINLAVVAVLLTPTTFGFSCVRAW